MALLVCSVVMVVAGATDFGENEFATVEGGLGVSVLGDDAEGDDRIEDFADEGTGRFPKGLNRGVSALGVSGKATVFFTGLT